MIIKAIKLDLEIFTIILLQPSCKIFSYINVNVIKGFSLNIIIVGKFQTIINANVDAPDINNVLKYENLIK